MRAVEIEIPNVTVTLFVVPDADSGMWLRDAHKVPRGRILTPQEIELAKKVTDVTDRLMLLEAKLMFDGKIVAGGPAGAQVVKSEPPSAQVPVPKGRRRRR